MMDYGCEAWKDYNEVLQVMVARLQNRLKVLKKDIQEVNWARKNQQTLVGERLRQLESQWVGLVSKNYEIEQAIAKMEAELPEDQRPEAADQEDSANDNNVEAMEDNTETDRETHQEESESADGGGGEDLSWWNKSTQ